MQRNNFIQRSYGFTLLELLVVLALLTLVITLIPPLFPNVIAGTQIKAATRQIASGLKATRQLAITRQREAVCTLDVAYKRFSCVNTHYQLDVPADTRLSLITANTELQNSQQADIRFFPDGSSTGGRVALAYNQDAYQIDVNWLTGKIKITP